MPVRALVTRVASDAAKLIVFLFVAARVSTAATRPNIVIIYCDDMGWGDLQCYGNKKFQTPNIDRMAEEGARLTDFTSCCPYCAPSRVGLQTGRYQFRSGLVDNPAPDAGPKADELGIPDSEITLGNLFQSVGYHTACVGKWHLGHKKQFMPLQHGYDEYLGILYSNDMHPVHMYEGNRLVRTLVVQGILTKLYTERALKIIEDHKDEPFFLYLAHAMPHKPLAASDRFLTRGGLYADVMAELDWSVGEILKKLEELELDEQTFVIFSSDNGPWYGGSTGGLRGMKGQTWEGGLRVPLVARWPGKIPEGHQSHEPCSIVDLFTTVLTAAGIPIPTDRSIDGRDIMPLLTTKATSPHEAIYSMKGDALCTVRSGKWKLHGPASGPRSEAIMPNFARWNDPRAPDGFTILAPRDQYHPSAYPGIVTGDGEGDWLLFDLKADPTEQKNVAAENPQVVERLRGEFDKLLEEMPEKSRKASLPKKSSKKGAESKSDEPTSDDKPAAAKNDAAKNDAAKKDSAKKSGDKAEKKQPAKPKTTASSEP
ncbi:MAG TPA: sulfatase [Pirellulales bacterium]|nr:sulfatase [Pirellulales bacterium]